MADIEKHLERAEKYVSKGKLLDAVQEYAAAYKLAPTNLDYLRSMGDLSAKAGKNEQALGYYGELFDKYCEKNDATRAIPLFRKSMQGASHPPERVARLGVLLQRSRKNDEAAEAFRNALELYQKAGNAAGGLDALQRLAEIETENADTHIKLGEQATKQGKADLAAKAFLRAGQLLRPENPDRALELLSRAYELAPERSTALSLAQSHVDRGHHKQAADLLTPLYAAGEKDQALLDTLSAALLAEKRLKEAEEVIATRYQSGPDGYERMFELADAYCKEKKAEKAVEVLRRVKENLAAAKRQKEFMEKLETVFKANDSLAPLAEFAASTFNEANQEGRYGTVLGKLFEMYCQGKEFNRAADSLERLIDIDPYDFANPKRLEALKGKIDEVRFRAVASRITSGATVTGQASVFSRADEKAEEAAPAGPAQAQAVLEDLIVQAEIFVQYSLKAKAIEKLQKIHQMFPAEGSRNERLYKLFELSGYMPPGVTPPPPGGLPAEAAPVSAAAAAPPPSAGGGETMSDLAKISEITHALYRQSTTKTVLHTAVSELGKYLKASRCLGALGRPGSPPSTAVEFCSPGVPQSPGPAVLKLLGLLGRQRLDPENGLVMDVNLTPDLKQVGAESVLAMPLIDKEKQAPVGLIVLSQSDRVRQWRPNEVYLLRAIADQAETAITNTKLRSLMKTFSVADEATGLLGRSSYLDCVVGEVSRAKTQGTPLVVALFELDKGNALMRQVGESPMQKFMQQCGEAVLGTVRQNDLAIRYTATSLAVVLGDTTAQKVQPVVEKLRKQLAGLKLPGGKDSLTFSAGVSEAAVRPDYDPLDIVTDVINRAELSLEEARKKGNAVVIR